MHDPELLELAGRYLDGRATAEEVRRLETALRTDTAFRRWFLRYAHVDAALGSTSVGSTEDSEKLILPRLAVGWRGLAWFAVAAAIVLAVVGLWQPWAGGGRSVARHEPVTTAPITPPPAVVLVSTTQAQWADADVELALRSGDLPAGTLRLDAGVAEFRFSGGATVVLLGPASVKFFAAGQMFLEEGKVFCRCPTPESRITVTTPATKVVDLGTEFAVDVPKGSPATHVAVVSGSVRVGSADPRVLRTGEAAEVGPGGVVRLTPLPADTLTALLSAAAGAGTSPVRTNLVVDATFEIDGAQSSWRKTEGNVDIVTTSAGSRAALVSARGHRFWPGVRQTIGTGDISGKLVIASVEGQSGSASSMEERQSAILKIAFLDASGREFATASRHFLHASDASAGPAVAELAAFAPAGTQAVQLQLLFNARGRAGGSVLFQNPRLSVTAKDRPATPGISSPASRPTDTASKGSQP